MSDLTRQQLCAALNISESTVRRMEREGMPTLSGGSPRRRVYDLEAIKTWCRREATPKTHEFVGPPKPDPWFLDPAARAYFSLDKPRPKWVPPVPLTATQKLKLLREQDRQREEDHRALVTFHANKRRAAKMQRTPPWADVNAMRSIYAEAQRLTRETGIPHHVDHEIPLQDELVSGLHVPNNLQILTGSENSKKRNRFEVE